MAYDKILYYKDSSMIWHICPLEHYPQSHLGRQGYVFPPLDNADILHLITGSRIHLMKIDVEDLWYIPDIESNIQMLDKLIECQRKNCEADLRTRWTE